jgi:hypothetical protein
MILCNITNVKGKWSINTPLSIAMFVYQRVYHGISHENPIKSRQNPMTSLWNPMKPLSIPWNHYKYPMNPKNCLPGATYDLGSPFPGFTPSTWAAASRLLIASKIPKLRDISVVYFPLGFPLGSLVLNEDPGIRISLGCTSPDGDIWWFGSGSNGAAMIPPIRLVVLANVPEKGKVIKVMK